MPGRTGGGAAARPRPARRQKKARLERRAESISEETWRRQV
ncbi:hypothetical protein BURMUCGD2M_0187 [Burkholderia multivorans CGD2M]|uniref:Uncharacterized protein n=1 Tax=Burkholderia multivorans CGD2 TaxID=513052 RepID=B9C074_9BURK|nr:hypothetical protein BURMUCGD1_0197 [Burkholderia multivorans CGD1]EEE03591.1 hypothetical protein BURMUCGD2_0188 [Burkholderia multivorans CGD2]EEE10171.1 hypothetical protein BURMUCGD2M_0187 [Burkholderia multivorans CGD2M]